MSSVPALHQTELKVALTAQEGKLDHLQLDLNALELADQGKENLLFPFPTVQSSSGLKVTMLNRSGGQTQYHQHPGGAAERPCGPNPAADYRCTTSPAAATLSSFHQQVVLIQPTKSLKTTLKNCCVSVVTLCESITEPMFRSIRTRENFNIRRERKSPLKVFLLVKSLTSCTSWKS